MPRLEPPSVASYRSPAGAWISVPVLRDFAPASSLGLGPPLSGRLRIGEVDLLVRQPVLSGCPDVEPAFWLADIAGLDAATAWRRLVDVFPETGLWPLLLTALDQQDRPWSSGELTPSPLTSVDALPAAAVLAGGWADSLVPMGENPYVEHLRPFGADFPGLAPPLPQEGPPASVVVDVVDPVQLTRLGLVRCPRPADAVTAIGWRGAINRRSSEEVSAVLRSWEDRFSAVLIGLGFARLTLLLPHPPSDVAEALHVAAEVAALCPDVLSEDGPVDGFGYEAGGTVAGLARVLVDRQVWTLWWD